VTVTIPAPMRASAGGKPFTSPDWLYEIKFDGYRCMARAGGGPVELRTKSGANCTAWYPEVARPEGGFRRQQLAARAFETPERW
jgi:ATP-dependent DNA ligase